MLGLYVSDHPLMGVEAALAKKTDATLADLRELAENSNGQDTTFRNVGGVITELKTKYTKKGDLMATFMLEDLQSSMEVFVFPKTMAEYGSVLQNDAVVIVKARLDIRDETPKIIAMEVSRPTLTMNSLTELRVRLAEDVDEETYKSVRRILGQHPGDYQVRIKIGEKIYKLPPEYNCEPRSAAVALCRFLGPEAATAV